MKLRYLTALLPFLAGCSPQEKAPVDPLPPELQQFTWLQTADSAKDADAAIAKKDYRLLAISGRGLMIPGIKAEDRPSAKDKCGVRFMEGMGDVLKDAEHRKWHKKGTEYAKAYNAIMSKHCL